MDSPGGVSFSDSNDSPGLRLDPFHAITYVNRDSLPNVTSPPYDVVGPEGVASLEAADPHNIVRLILPHSQVGEAADGDSRHRRAADALDQWHDSGVLATDDRSALWVYRHTTNSGVAVGLVGAVGVDGPIHPHESTFDGPVADRAALMITTGAQLEPILLTYHGDGVASDVVDTALTTPPTISTVVEDGSRHELWRLQDPAVHARVSADLTGRQALIADGHHRFSAYQRVHATKGSAATSTGLAVLVDATRHPLTLRGVHRVISGLSMDAAVDMASAAGFTLEEGGPANDHLVDNRRIQGSWHDGSPDRATFVLTDGDRTVRISATDEAYRAVPGTEPERQRAVDAAVLKYALLRGAWEVDDVDRRVSYIHDATDASALARKHAGVAVLVAPPRLADVMKTAEAGATMPQKSTSFGPKPRTGLLMRWTR